MIKKIFLPILKLTFWPSFIISAFLTYQSAISTRTLSLSVLAYLALNLLVVFLILRAQVRTKKFEDYSGSIWLTIYGVVLLPILSYAVVKVAPGVSHLLQDNWYAITSAMPENKSENRYEVLPGEVYGRSSLNAYVFYSNNFGKRKIVLESESGNISNKYDAIAFWSLELPYSLGYTPVGTDSLEHHKIVVWGKGWLGGIRKLGYLVLWIPAVSLFELVLRSIFTVFPIMVLAQIVVFITTGYHFIAITRDDVIHEYRRGAFGSQSEGQALIYRASLFVNKQVRHTMGLLGFPLSRLYLLRALKSVFPTYYARIAWRYIQIYDVVAWAVLSEFCVYLRQHSAYSPEWEENLKKIHSFSLGEEKILKSHLQENRSKFTQICQETQLCVPPEVVTNGQQPISDNTVGYVTDRLEKIFGQQQNADDWRVREILTQANIYVTDFKPLCLLDLYNQVSSEQVSKDNPDNLRDKAEIAPKSLKVLLRAIQIKLENKHPNLLVSSGWKDFVLFGTVAGCVSLAIRLGDIPEETRTEIELTMRESLKSIFPKSERLYTDCYHYVTQSLSTMPRAERAKNLFLFISKWALSLSTNSKEADMDTGLLAQMADFFQNETVGYWGAP